MFEPLSHQVLRRLLRKGYNVLKSPSPLGSESPTYYPDRIEGDISSYFNDLAKRNKSYRLDHFLFIDEALQIPEEDLFGYVLTGLE